MCPSSQVVAVPRLQFKGWDGREESWVHLSVLDAYSDAGSSFPVSLVYMICLSLHASACSFKLTPGSLLYM